MAHNSDETCSCFFGTMLVVFIFLWITQGPTCTAYIDFSPCMWNGNFTEILTVYQYIVTDIDMKNFVCTFKTHRPKNLPCDNLNLETALKQSNSGADIKVY